MDYEQTPAGGMESRALVEWGQPWVPRRVYVIAGVIAGVVAVVVSIVVVKAAT